MIIASQRKSLLTEYSCIFILYKGICNSYQTALTLLLLAMSSQEWGWSDSHQCLTWNIIITDWNLEDIFYTKAPIAVLRIVCSNDTSETGK